MVGLAQKILHLYPSSRSLVDWTVTSIAGVESVTQWDDAAMGPQPTQEQLDAMTHAVEVEIAGVAINAAREVQLNAGVEYNGHMFDSDVRSILNLTSVVSLVNSGVPLPDGFAWRSADNINVRFTVIDLIGLGAAMLAHQNEAYQKSWADKAAIEAAG